MGKKTDITGQRFGRLTVIKELESINYQRRWLCKCDCGQEKSIYHKHLKAGTTKSCGCFRKERDPSNLVDLTGKTFNHLTVLGRSDKKSKHSAVWTCKCECGNIAEIESGDLQRGKTKSCGCLKELTGKRVSEFNVKSKVDGIVLPQLTKKHPLGASGVKGVRIRRIGNKVKWEAHIGIKNKNIFLGRFDTIGEAARARKAGEEKYYKPYLEK